MRQTVYLLVIVEDYSGDFVECVFHNKRPAEIAAEWLNKYRGWTDTTCLQYVVREREVM